MSEETIGTYYTKQKIPTSNRRRQHETEIGAAPLPGPHRHALYEHDEALCVLRPGGGKTIAALTAIDELLARRRDPPRAGDRAQARRQVVWPDEIAEWAHTPDMCLRRC